MWELIRPLREEKIGKKEENEDGEEMREKERGEEKGDHEVWVFPSNFEQ